MIREIFRSVRKLGIPVVLLLISGFTLIHPSWSEDNINRRRLVEEALKLSGIEDSLLELPGVVNNLLSIACQNADPTTQQKILEVVNDSINAEDIYHSVADYYENQYDQNLMRDFLREARTPFIQGIIQLERAADRLEDSEEKKQFMESLKDNPPSDKRIVLMKELSQYEHVSRMSMTIMADVINGGLQIMDSVMPSEDILSQEQIDKMVAAIIGNPNEQETAMISNLIFIYRTVSDQDLEKYIRFCASKSGKWFSDTSFEALEKMLVTSAETIANRLTNMFAKEIVDSKALSRRARALDQLSQYTEAAGFAWKQLDMAKKSYPPDDPIIGDALYDLGVCYFHTGDIKKAKPLLELSLKIREKALGTEDPSFANTLDALAQLYTAEGKYRKAESIEKQALEIMEKALGPYHADVASALNNLANINLAMKKWSEAKELYQKALSIGESNQGPEGIDVGLLLGNLGVIAYEEKDYETAEKLFTRSLNIKKKTINREHPALADAFVQLAEVYFVQERYHDAYDLYKSAHSIYKKAGGAEHPVTKMALERLNACENKSKKLE